MFMLMIRLISDVYVMIDRVMFVVVFSNLQWLRGSVKGRK